MNLMVYGTYGRFAVYMIQDLMRLVNREERNPRRKIDNTQKMLQNLPPAHWFNVSQHLGLKYSDTKNEAGLYDLFLHSQDKPFSIVEVYDWLERCGLKMSGEPGFCYGQLEYLPETYIKDESLLALVKTYPVKIQQGIAEIMSSHIGMHEFYAVHKSAGETVASITDMSLVPWGGMNSLASFEQMAAASIQQKGSSFTMNFEALGLRIIIPAGIYVADILRRIDGQRSVGDIIKEIRADKKYGDAPPSEDDVMKEFATLFTSLNRGAVAFLRAPSVEPYVSIPDMQKRTVKNI